MTKRLIVEIEKDLHDKIKGKAYAEGKTIKGKVLELLDTWMNKGKKR